MFNNTSNANSQSQHVTFNSVAGTLIKSTSESKFMRMHMNSQLAGHVFDKDKPRASTHRKAKEIQVLQVMLCANEWLLVEFIELAE